MSKGIRVMVKAPNGELISHSTLKRITEARPALEQANAERLSRPEAASRVLIEGTPISDLTVYTYVRLLGIQWNHRQDYRKAVDRDKLRAIAVPMLRLGHTFKDIAAKAGCSICTVARFAREDGLVDDGNRYCGLLDPARSNRRRRSKLSR